MPVENELEEALIKRITDKIRAGNYPSTASWSCGVDPKKLIAWGQKGELEGEGPYYELFIAVNQTVALSEADLVEQVQEAANTGDWKAAAWLLERRHAVNWSPKSQAQLNPASDANAPEQVREQLESKEVRKSLSDVITAMANAQHNTQRSEEELP